MSIERDSKVIEQINKLGILSVGMSSGMSGYNDEPVVTDVFFSLVNNEEKMQVTSSDQVQVSSVLETLLMVSFLLTGEQE